MPLIDKKTRDRIRELNNAFRTSFDAKLGQVMLTTGVNSLPSDVRAMAIRKTATFDAFTPDNDPHGEHDFGNFELAGRRFFVSIRHAPQGKADERLWSVQAAMVAGVG